MTTTQRKIFDLFEQWQAAKQEVKKCVDSCSGDSDYFCSDQIHRAEQIGTKFWEAIDAYSAETKVP